MSATLRNATVDHGWRSQTATRAYKRCAPQKTGWKTPMKRAVIATAFALLAACHAAAAEESRDRSVAACKAVAGPADKSHLAELSEDDLKEKMCLSSLSVVRSADPMAGMECRLAFKALLGEFSRRHPGKEMKDVYGRC